MNVSYITEHHEVIYDHMSVKYLGGAGTYNIATDPDLGPYYQYLTNDNFFYRVSNSSGLVYSNHFEKNRVYTAYTAPSISYDPTTGVLTCSNGYVSGYGIATNVDSSEWNYRANFSNLGTGISVYCMFAE